ncbi:CRISPR-associated endonuclease Cas3'' [Rhodovulum strictum]|uniref:CRISPR-associated endonuclease Cas3 n=1 Tax=Rhodovulum strictum TaxID=58314 RepID=A0A844BJM8_9RHOB|nr:CRISPR-associated endonuclease Cas3'' [Rhodovulum strictum]MRH22749.1 CRISPR-associated endonuclease Cas3'' [Rhodovulum strictum]
MIYAHSGEKSDRTDWESLYDHAAAVGQSAGNNAAAFAQDIAVVAGWLHDLGKMKPRFQARLSDPSVVEPHAAEGARFALHHLPGPFGPLVAQAILGHHAGLGNGGGQGRSLGARLDEAEALDPPADWPIPDITALPASLRSLDHPDLAQLHYSLSFLGRMIFSALVDADRSETAAFYARLSGTASSPKEPAALTTLRDRLDLFMAARNTDGPVNGLRRAVHSHVRSAAAEVPGLFTLTVPTGGGKTLASLSFALDHAIRHGMERVIYVIPYTSIVEQTAAVFREVFDGLADAVLEHHSSFDWQDVCGDDERASLKVAAESWDRPVIVTTAVQFFESLHAARGSPCRKLHRIANAVVVLDEAQTLPRHLLRPSLAALKELARGYRGSVVFCTATQPALRRADGFPHPEGLDSEGPMAVRELAPDPAALYERLRRVRVEHAGSLDNVALAAELRDSPQGLAILNNRRQARAVFEVIRDLPGAFHLSTNMTARHRRQVLDAVRRGLASDAPVRLVSTSLVEAGVDVSFATVFRALAGLDSIAQAAGRCNREGRMEGPGRVVVFEAELGERGEFAPPSELRQLAEVARGVLERHSDDPLSLDAVRDYFRQAFWNQAHGMDNGKVAGQPFEILRAIALAQPERRPVFPYASIAEAYRIIPGGALPVVVCGDDWGLPEEELQRLHHVQSAGGVARALQSYQVQVPERVRRQMHGEGVLRPFRPEEFGEQFLLLDQPGLYDTATGLRWDDFGDLGFLSF